MKKRVLTVKEMADIQDRLNELTQNDWKNTLTKDHFRVALFDELAELLGSGRKWKWWKASGNPDTFNEKIEVIDVVHFYLSVMMLEYIYLDTTTVLGLSKDEVLMNWLYDEDAFSHGEFMKQARQLLMNGSSFFLNEFVRSAGLTQEETSALYVAKATLNEIRQSQGYKTGEYVKVKDGIEDNQRLKNIIEDYLSDPSKTLEDVRERTEQEFFIRK